MTVDQVAIVADQRRRGHRVSLEWMRLVFLVPRVTCVLRIRPIHQGGSAEDGMANSKALTGVPHGFVRDNERMVMTYG